MASNVAHEARNWLHYLVLAVTVAEVDTVAKGFARAHPLEVGKSDTSPRWQSWEEWRAYLEMTLGSIKPIDVTLRLLGPQEIEVDAEQEQVEMRWRMQAQLRGRQEPPMTLDCEATLVKEEGKWVACRLRWSEQAGSSAP
jgi:hypothetical protein